MIEQYKLVVNGTEAASSREKREASYNHPRHPTCSVIFKHLKEEGEIVMGHNTWHEYRAMSFR